MYKFRVVLPGEPFDLRLCLHTMRHASSGIQNRLIILRLMERSCISAMGGQPARFAREGDASRDRA